MRNLFLSIICLFSLILAACTPAQPTTAPTDLPEASASTIGYPSVAAALAALQAREDVTVEVQEGWTIVTEADGLTTWSFTPAGHPAHPAVAKRVLDQENGSWLINMDILCEADQAACDQFVRDFEALNEQMRQFIQQDPATPQAE
jgi:hypothetical protein